MAGAEPDRLALRFFYGVTLGQATVPERIAYASEPSRCPFVLSPDEVVRFPGGDPKPQNAARADHGGTRLEQAGDGAHLAAHIRDPSLGERGGVRIIQVLLGHTSLSSTARYTRVATKTISNTPSPLDRLRLEVVSPG